MPPRPVDAITQQALEMVNAQLGKFVQTIHGKPTPKKHG